MFESQALIDQKTLEERLTEYVYELINDYKDNEVGASDTEFYFTARGALAFARFRLGASETLVDRLETTLDLWRRLKNLEPGAIEF